MKKFIYILLALCVFSFTACRREIKKVEEKPVVQETIEKEFTLNIVTTNKLLYNMVREISGDRHSIDYMFTSRDKLWNFDYTEDSLNNISRKDLFFYWGSGLEPWASDFTGKLSKSRVGAISLARGIKLTSLSKEMKYKDTTVKDNPYFWMNIDNYKIAMLNIKNAIQDKDTKDRDFYEKNFSETIKKVEDTQKMLKEAADKLKGYTFIVDGDELDYFTGYYGFKVLKLANYGPILSPEDMENNRKVEEKLKEVKDAVFLYDQESQLKTNEAIIKTYSLKTANIMVYKDDIKYLDLLNDNLKALQGLAPAQ